MSVQTFIKDPLASLDYGFNWTEWLEGRTLVLSTWTVTPSGLTIVSESNSATQTLIILSGGTVGKSYTVTNTITSTDGITTYEDERSITIQVQYR